MSRIIMEARQGLSHRSQETQHQHHNTINHHAAHQRRSWHQGTVLPTLANAVDAADRVTTHRRKEKENRHQRERTTKVDLQAGFVDQFETMQYSNQNAMQYSNSDGMKYSNQNAQHDVVMDTENNRAYSQQHVSGEGVMLPGVDLKNEHEQQLIPSTSNHALFNQTTNKRNNKTHVLSSHKTMKLRITSRNTVIAQRLYKNPGKLAPVHKSPQSRHAGEKANERENEHSQYDDELSPREILKEKGSADRRKGIAGRRGYSNENHHKSEDMLRMYIDKDAPRDTNNHSSDMDRLHENVGAAHTNGALYNTNKERGLKTLANLERQGTMEDLHRVDLGSSYRVMSAKRRQSHVKRHNKVPVTEDGSVTLPPLAQPNTTTTPSSSSLLTHHHHHSHHHPHHPKRAGRRRVNFLPHPVIILLPSQLTSIIIEEPSPIIPLKSILKNSAKSSSTLHSRHNKHHKKAITNRDPGQDTTYLQLPELLSRTSSTMSANSLLSVPSAASISTMSQRRSNNPSRNKLGFSCSKEFEAVFRNMDVDV